MNNCISSKLAYFFILCLWQLQNAYAIETPGVVLNEIMYRSGSTSTLDEFIELHNSSSQPVSLANWQINKGVSFTFPSITLNAGGYLVVAADVLTFTAKYPGVTNVIGPWVGKLSNSRETIQLVNAQGLIVDSVTYADEGEWAIRTRGPLDHNHTGWIWSAGHNGGGKSLELINPAMPNQFGGNWGSSTAAGGTPGAANSIAAANIAPVISAVQHFPIVPKSTQTVLVTARVVDESDATATATVYYRKDGAATFSTSAMFDDGLHGDGGAHDGLFGATLPVQTNNSVVEFYVSATDVLNQTRTWPGPSQPTNTQLTNCLYQVDDAVPDIAQPLYKLIMTDASRLELNTMFSSDTLSNAQMNGTFVSVDAGGTQLRYLCGFRNRGHGSRNGVPHNFHIAFRSDDPWKGVEAINVNARYTHCQILGAAVFRSCQVPVTNAVPVHVRVNNGNLAVTGSPMYGHYAHNDVLDSNSIANLYPNDSGGNLYHGVQQDPPLTADANLVYLGTNPAPYRLVYFKETNAEADDWTDLIHLIDVMNNAADGAYELEVKKVVDVDNWLRFFAVQAFLANNETTLSAGIGDDYALYRGLVDTRFKLHGYDLDTILGTGDMPGTATDSIFRMTGIASLDRFIKAPEIAPQYFSVLHNFGQTVFSAAQFNALVDQTVGGLYPATVTDAFKNFMVQRGNYIRSQIPLALTVTSQPPSANGYPRTTSPAAALAGRSNAIKTRSVRVNGVAATWSAWEATWSAPVVTLQPGINRVVIQALDAVGAEFERTFVDIWYDKGTTSPLTGTLAADTTLAPAPGPYLITGDLIVPVGVTLTIQPGTSLFFNPNCGIKVFGRIVAEGTDTQRVRMSRVPGAAGAWNGIVFTNTVQNNRLSYIDFEYADNLSSRNINASGSALYIDNATWSQTQRQILNLDNSSMILKNSVLPTIANAEHVHFNVMPANGYLLIIGNTFGSTTGYNDICDLTGGNRPGPIIQIWNNVFLGGSDDGIDLDGTDAHIEGNVFMNIRKNNTSNSDSHAITTGVDGANTSELYIARNLIVNCDHAVLCKQNGFMTIQNNTIVGSSIAAINFLDEQTSNPPPGPGKGVIADGNIFWNNPAVFRNVVNGVSATIKNSIVPSTDLGSNVTFGPGNIVADPQFVSATDFHLKSSSPALGHGPNGLDMGVYVPQGASIYNVPHSPTNSTSATLIVDGPSIVAYKYSLDGGPYSAEALVSVPITLTNLSLGPHSVSVLGKNDAGFFQDQGPVPTTAAVSKSWTVVAPPIRRVLINEVLADNKTVFSNSNTWPDVIELFNDGASIDLADMSLSDDASAPRQFIFPPNTVLAAGQYMLVLADSVPAPGLHTGFGLKKTGEKLSLFDTLARGGGLLDSVEFGIQLEDRSIGRLADGTWNLCVPTLGAVNVFQPLSSPAGLKINEWLATGQGQFKDDFVELYNPAPLPAPLSGLYLTDNTLSEPLKYKVPALSFIEGTRTVGSGLALFTADDDAEKGPDHLNFKLAAEGGRIGLSDAAGAPLDTIIYGLQTVNVAQGRMPNGAALVGVFPPTPSTDNPQAPNVTVTITNLIPIDKVWKYDQADTFTSTSWQATGFNDTGANWSSGAGLFYVESAALPASKNTALTIGRNTYFFRTHFTFTGTPSKTILKLKAVVDDGAVFYLNGTEVFRLGMNATGSVTYTTPANRNVGDAVFDGAFTIPSTALISGDNVMAVRVHQFETTSDDVVFGMTLDAEVSNISSSLATPVVINEISTRPAPGQKQFIEIFNPTAVAADISGWYLTDDTAVPKKWQIPTTSPIVSGGYQSFDDAQFGASFRLNPLGGTIYLYSADTNQVLTGYVNGFAYGASALSTSFGRYVISTGENHYPAQTALSSAASNAGPSVGPVVISEIMYKPPSGGDSFLELTNITAFAVKLYDPANPLNTWRLNGVDFSFPQNFEIPASGVVIISSISPQLFRMRYNVPPNVQVVGPYGGSLQNSGELLELQKPDAPTLDGLGNPVVPYIVVDAVRYSDSAPWPTEPDGGGPSLERIDNNAYGNDPINWRASSVAFGTPGNARVWDGGGDGQFWTSFGNWDTNNLPVSSAATALVFKAAGVAPYAASNDLGNPFSLNSLVINSTVAGNSLGGQPLQFGGTSPVLAQNGNGSFSIAANLVLAAPLAIGGDGPGELTLSGVLLGATALTKSGVGTATLSGASTYSGGTFVNGGVLAVANTVDSGTGIGPVKVNPGAVVRGTGTIAGSIAATGGKVASGSSSATGTLTAGGADFSAGGTLSIRALSPSNVDRLNLANATTTGTLTMGGTSVLEIDLAGFTGSGEFVIAQANAWSTSAPFATVNVLNAGANVAKVSYMVVNTTTRRVLLSVNNGVSPVTVGNFHAIADGAGVKLSWTAVSEFQNAGFNLYRRSESTEVWARINPVLIPGRITNPDEKEYRFYDWAAPGSHVYKLESVSIRGELEAHSECAGPVALDTREFSEGALTETGLNAATHSIGVTNNALHTAGVAQQFAAIETPPEIQGTAVELSAAADHEVRVREVSSAATAASPSVGVRWFSSARPSRAPGSAVKIVYDKPGVMLVPRASLPPNFSCEHLSIQREGRTITALAVTPAGLLLYGSGYQDQYTDKDAFFLRSISGATQAGSIGAASGLFNSPLPVALTTQATSATEFHDVYFDYDLRPYTFEPWFSGQYLTGGTTQTFSIDSPGAVSAAATLSMKLWSLTQTDGVSPDHALQVLVNGTPAGQVQWSGGNKPVQLLFQIPAGVLNSGANQIQLVTPRLDGVDSGSGSGQIALLHSLALNYTRSLDASKPLDVYNPSSTPKLFEAGNLPSPAVWVVDARNADRAALVPCEAQRQANGTYAVRFVAHGGGTGRYLVVPAGQENTPLSISRRQIKPVQVAPYVAIGPTQFGPAIRPLLQKHAKDGLRGVFVDQEQIFDYYNHGRYGPSGIQNAVRSVRPQFLLLTGRTTYDYRNYSGLNVDPLCPAFLVSTAFWSQTTSDALYGDLGRGFPEVAVGRLPANDPAELATMVKHVLANRGLTSNWRIHTVADAFDPGVGDFAAEADAIAQSHPEIAWQRNYLGVTGPASSDVTSAMKEAANGGADAILYFGHGNAVRLGKNDPRFLDVASVKEWTGNVVLLQATCTANWVAKNEEGYRSIAIQALAQPQGGISASIGSSTYVNAHDAAEFMRQLIAGANQAGTRWGSALLKTQQWALLKGGSQTDLGRTEQLLGDPAMPVFEKGTRRNGKLSDSERLPGTF